MCQCNPSVRTPYCNNCDPKKLVRPSIATKKLVTERDILSALGYWAVGQDPYNFPIEFDVVVQKLKTKIRDCFEATCTDFYTKDFEDRELNEWLDETLKSIPEFNNWNLSRHEISKGISVDDPNRGGYAFVSVVSTLKQEHDFIDLDALIRNVANMVMRKEEE